MPSCDYICNADEFNSVFRIFPSLNTRGQPNYIICGGDFNVELTRLLKNTLVISS